MLPLSRSNSRRTVPVTVLSGFLGSGKTTLLKGLLKRPELADTAVVINELGDVPIDNLLVRSVRDDVVVLASGCVCCSVQSDLVRTLCDLYVKASRGQLPKFSRVLLETTGIADPAPVLATLATHGLVRYGFHLQALVTAVDAVLSPHSFARHPEAVKQVALADRWVLTKTDVASDPERVRTAEALRAIRASVPWAESILGSVEPAFVFAPVPPSNDEDLTPAIGCLPLKATFRMLPPSQRGEFEMHASITTFSVVSDKAPHFSALALWLAMMVNVHGERLLRIKGIIDAGSDGPVAIQAVQHVVYPPMELEAWPSEDRRSRLVFIGRSLDLAMEHAIKESFYQLCGR